MSKIEFRPVPRPSVRAESWTPRGPVRVLLVVDQPQVVQLVKLTLHPNAYETRVTATCSGVMTTVATWRPHLVLVDLDLEGGSIVRQIGATAAVGVHLPLFALTRHGSLDAKLAAFASGADDILTIPFAPEELLARVVAVVRRSYSDAVSFTPTIKLGELEIDILKRTVYDGTSELQLTSLEQSLLYLLAANAGRVVTREEILDTLWGTDYVASSNVVDRQIRSLRTLLRDDWREPRFIATVPGRGYQFVGPIAAKTNAAAS